VSGAARDLNEVEQAEAKPVRAFTLITSANVIEQEQKARKRARAAAEYDAMVATRPLKPPSMPSQPSVVTAGALALARDKKLGVYHGAVDIYGAFSK
jgi:hypothetical protein